MVVVFSACDSSKAQFEDQSPVSAYAIGAGSALANLGVTKYENGQLKSDATYDSIREWHENGNPKREVNFVNGRIDGVYLTSYADGGRHAEVNYRGGQRQGESYEWYENGQLKEKSSYLDGVADGEYLGLYRAGEKRFNATYKKGKIDGLFLQWRVDGKLRLEQNDKNGILVSG